MLKLETTFKAIVKRLARENWSSEGRAKHEKFAHPERPGVKIMVPRHRTLSPGVARSIARAAGWAAVGDEDVTVRRPD